MTKAKYFGNARNYKNAMMGIIRHKKLAVRFEDIDYKWLSDLETSMKASSLKTNTIAMYMRHLRGIYNKAINHEIVSANHYPFRRYKIKSEQTDPRSLPLDEIQRFFRYHPDPNHPTYNAWNYGKLIFMLRGINFFDLALLTDDNVRDGRILYKRQKTHKPYSIAILYEVDKILTY